MGYSPWGHKELDTTEPLRATQTPVVKSTYHILFFLSPIRPLLLPFSRFDLLEKPDYSSYRMSLSVDFASDLLLYSQYFFPFFLPPLPFSFQNLFGYARS